MTASAHPPSRMQRGTLSLCPRRNVLARRGKQKFSVTNSRASSCWARQRQRHQSIKCFSRPPRLLGRGEGVYPSANIVLISVGRPRYYSSGSIPRNARRGRARGREACGSVGKQAAASAWLVLQYMYAACKGRQQRGEHVALVGCSSSKRGPTAVVNQIHPYSTARTRRTSCCPCMWSAFASAVVTKEALFKRFEYFSLILMVFNSLLKLSHMAF